MASTYENSPALASAIANVKGISPQKATIPPASPEELAADLEQLRDRFRKTTNALASAAHDLKTPLAILERLHRTVAEPETRPAQ